MFSHKGRNFMSSNINNNLAHNRQALQKKTSDQSKIILRNWEPSFNFPGMVAVLGCGELPKIKCNRYHVITEERKACVWSEIELQCGESGEIP